MLINILSTNFALTSGNFDNSIHLWDVKTGQQKAKLDGHSRKVLSVCFSPDVTTLASGRGDQSIRLWDVKTGKPINQTDNRYSKILAQFYTPLFYNSQLPQSIINHPKLIISSEPTFYAQGALILNGQFLTHQGYDLKHLIKTQGGYFLESNLELFQKKN
ncbi:unnamed protein product [Paramecium sonneborni]|uniref:Uncharacterized protein n=1 Tax=Paramecium sonneborni TaxID=65129 RepID=A0A8S1PWG2_9CILI|nr:unnamed protein product [Paramecium sonneborni]